jgi:hypothetical protein
VVRGLDERPDEGGEADDRQCGPAHVEAGLGGVPGLGQEPAAGDEREDDERDVDEQHRAPPEVLEQPAAGDRSDGDAEPGDAGPGGDGPRPLLRVGEQVGDDRQGRRHDEGGAEAEHGSGGDQLLDAARERSGDRGDAEERQSAGQGAASPVAVTEAPGGQQQAGEHQDVGVDDPLEIAGRGTEVGREGRQRHVEDRVVEHDEEQAQAQDPEGQPPPRVRVVSHRSSPLAVEVARTRPPREDPIPSRIETQEARYSTP